MNLNQLKAQAQDLGITPQEARAHGNLNNKVTWEKAIRYHETLQAQANEENRQAKVGEIYQSPGAALIVPVAGVAAYGQALLNGIRRSL